MSQQPFVKPGDVPEVFAGRYRVDQLLGQGGMGAVYRVVDNSTGERLALKLSSVAKRNTKQAERLARFEREYYTLEQLKHPRIVKVYDYGVESSRAYYTMELLDGGDLRDRAPMGWMRACALLIDVASALALLHSRRMVHRDLNPHNIRYTAQGLAKLFDFGALAPMGPCKSIVGTPACTPPEMMNHQALDARADMYALGATAYYVLTGRNAFPARSFAQLRDIWRSRPIPPSDIVDVIPEALDNLVMSLLNLDMASRPSSAAEVMERLNAISGMERTEELAVSHAYLATPTLVGRDDALVQVRRRMLRALSGQGGVLLVRGAAGIGRTRFLDASVLEGKLAGATVLRADSGDAWTGDYGVVRVLLEQLWEKLPDVASAIARPHASVLGHVFPELAERVGQTTLTVFRDRSELRPKVQLELRTVLSQLSRINPLVIAIDDLHRIDEPSAAFLAALGHKAASSGLVVIGTVETGSQSSAPTALKLFSEYAEPIVLRALSAGQMETLVRSIFGDVPNVQLVAHWLYGLCDGNPRTVMELAQHLVDRGAARYDTGRWCLPSHLNDGDLPTTLWVAMEGRAHALSADAREVASVLALGSTEGLSPQDYAALTEHKDVARVYRALDQLVATQVLGGDGLRYRFTQPAWPALFLRQLSKERERQLHASLGELFARDGGDKFHAAHHLIVAGDEARGIDFLVEGLKPSWKALEDHTESMDDFLHAKRPYLNAIEVGLSRCEALGRRKRDYFLLLSAVVLVGQYADRSVALRYIPTLFGLLYRASGLDIWETLDDALAAEERLRQALQLAQQRYESTPAQEKTISPATAIAQLARLFIQVAALASTLYDLPLLESAPSIAPLVPLSPALGVVKEMTECVALAIGGRLKQARRGLLAILQRLGPLEAAIDDKLVYQYVGLGVMHALARIEAEMGLESALARADALDSDPLHQVNGWWARMTYYLCFGDKMQAEQCRARAELLQIQNSPLEILEGVVLTNQLLCYARAEDLLGVKQVTDSIETMAKSYPGWVPYLHVGLGENHRIVGDDQSALLEFEQTLSLTAPGRHLAWQWAAGSRVRILERLGRYQEAKQLAQEALSACEKADILYGYDISDIIHALALAEARLGRHETAVRTIERLIEIYREDEVAGLPLGLAYETRARIAILMGDTSNFKSYSGLIAELPGCGFSVTLTARYEKLMAEAAKANMAFAAPLSSSDVAADSTTADVRSAMENLLAFYQDPAARAKRVFELLVEHSGALGGLLFLLSEGGPRLAMCHGDVSPSDNFHPMLYQYLQFDQATNVADLDKSSDTDSKDDEEEKGYWVSPQGERYRRILLGIRQGNNFIVVGMAALRVSPFRTPRVFWDVVGVLSTSLLEAGDKFFESTSQQPPP
jgi:tetratricopeptide (TPR) repeat protein